MRTVLLAFVVATLVLPGMVPGASGDTAPVRSTHSDTVVQNLVPREFPTALLDLQALLEGIRGSGHTDVTLGDLQVSLDAVPYDMRAPGWQATLHDETGSTVVEVDLGTYRAALAGSGDYSNPLTATEGYVNFMIQMAPCKILVVESTEEGEAAPLNAHPVYVHIEECPEDPSTRSVEGHKDNACPWNVSSLIAVTGAPNIQDPTCDTPTAPLTILGVGATVTGWTKPTTTKVLKVGLGSDTSYYSLATSTWSSRQAAVLNNADNNVFRPTVNVDLQIAHQFTYTSGGPTMTLCDSTATTSDVIDTFTNKWQTDSTLSAVTRDTTLNLYERVMSSSTTGCAWTPGIDDPTNYGYAVVQTKSRDSTQEYKDAAHELGHNAYGEHGAAEKYHDGTKWVGTIMATYMESENKINKFSEGTDDDYNSYRIRYCVEHKSTCFTDLSDIPEP